MLAGRINYGQVHGRVAVNGQLARSCPRPEPTYPTHSGIEADLSALKQVTGLVDKEDVIPPTMTVEEILTFNACTRLADKEKREEAVSWALHVREWSTCRCWMSAAWCCS